jgi:hypothetical protein
VNKALSLFLISGLALATGCGGGSAKHGSSSGGGAASSGESVSVAVSPTLSFYPLASDVSLTATVTDAKGAPVANANVTWTLDPSDAAAPSSMAGSFTLNKPGPLTFKACTTPSASGSAPVCGEAIIQVEPQAPVLVVQSPRPGDELGGNGATTFPVKGTVTTTGTAHVFVDGMEVMVGTDGSFQTDVPAFFGVNHLIVSATDGENPEVRDELDVAFGAAYAPAVDAMGAPALSEPDALVLQLGQNFFDDGVAVPLTAPHPVVLPDIADIVTRVVAGMDLQSQIPNPVVSSSAATLQVTSVTLDDITVQIELVDGGLDLFVRVGALSLGTTGSLSLASSMISLDGGIDAAVSAFAHASISKASPADPVVVSVGTFDVVLETATGAFTDPQANAIFALASGFLKTTVQQQLQSALSGTLQNTVPQAIEGVFQSLDTALANQTIPINASPLPAVSVTLNGHTSELDIVPMDWMKVALSLDVKTDQSQAAHPSSRGVALIDTSTAEPLFVSPRSQLGIQLVVVNGLLHELWDSGLLEVPVSNAIPLAISGKLPPIARLPREGETNDLVISLGQLEVTPNGDDTNGRLGVLIEAGLDVNLANNALSMKLAATPKVTVWIITPPQGTTLYTPQFLTTLIQGTVWPKLQSGIGGALSIQLPIPPLDALASVAPSLAGLQLTIGLNHKITYRNGFLVLDADIAATLP